MPPAPAADRVADRHWTREVTRRLEADYFQSAKTHLIGLDLPPTVLTTRTGAVGSQGSAATILCDSGLRDSDTCSAEDRRSGATRYGAFLGEAA
ncbi:hypothetical protein ACFQ15_07230 [Sphingomonas hankookensis]|uniref:hypothetical protein n=1 Tax=Sphingomonas hankookensis TaxID=563996 RepID=UPI003634D55D